MGVVGAIVPWNFPLIMAAWKIGPVLAAGNSLVLKPSEKSPFTALRIAQLAVRGRHSGRRVQRGAGIRPHRRQGAGAAHGRGLHRLHRLHRHRRLDHAVRRRSRTSSACRSNAAASRRTSCWRTTTISTGRARGRGRDLLQPGRDVLGGLAPAGAGRASRTRCSEKVAGDRRARMQPGDPLDPRPSSARSSMKRR